MRFLCKRDAAFVFTPFLFVVLYWVPVLLFKICSFMNTNVRHTRFPYQMMLVLLNNKMTGATSGAGTAYLSEFTLDF